MAEEAKMALFTAAVGFVVLTIGLINNYKNNQK